MKPAGLLFLIGIFAAASLFAQKPLKLKTDSLLVSQGDSLYSGQYGKQVKQPYSIKIDSNFIVPEKRFVPNRQSLTFVPGWRKSVIRDPKTHMPVWVPKYHSNMPVMKPDSTIHYFLRIKKY